MCIMNRSVGSIVLAPGRHVFAPLPGSLRRSAKTFTAEEAISSCSRASGGGSANEWAFPLVAAPTYSRR
jgi:hypothetical protein